MTKEKSSNFPLLFYFPNKDFIIPYLLNTIYSIYLKTARNLKIILKFITLFFCTPILSSTDKPF